MAKIQVREVIIVMASIIVFASGNSTISYASYMFTRLCFYSSINTTSSAARSSLECAVSCTRYGGCNTFRFCISETTHDCGFLQSYVPNYDAKCLDTASTWMCKYSKRVTSPTNATSTTMTTSVSQSSTALVLHSTTMMSTTPSSVVTTTKNNDVTSASTTTTQNSDVTTTTQNSVVSTTKSYTTAQKSTTSGYYQESGEDD